MPPKFTEEDDAVIVEELKKKTDVDDIAKKLNKTFGSTFARSRVIAAKLAKEQGIDEVAKELHIPKEDLEPKKKKASSGSSQNRYSQKKALDLLDKLRAELLKGEN